MNTPIKLYLSSETIVRLRQKAQEAGFHGRGNISRYISYLASHDLAILDNNIKKVLTLLNGGKRK